MLEKDPPLAPTKKFRLGGIVREGSVTMSPSSPDVRFTITDMRYGAAVGRRAPRWLAPAPDGSPVAVLHAIRACARNDIEVVYTGALPDLFHEGSGAVAEGYLQPTGVFKAVEVLAKHDENYMPPELAKELDKTMAAAAEASEASATEAEAARAPTV